MSLSKNLWLSVICLMLLLFSGVFAVSNLSSREYFEQQLSAANSSNALVMALSLSEGRHEEDALRERLRAQSSTGQFEYIKLTDSQGRLTYLSENKQDISGAPAWFARLFPVHVNPGEAQVRSGKKFIGTLTLLSQPTFAYQAFWESTLRQGAIFLAGILLAGFLGNHLLKIILKPLDDVVEQAVAIAERRFVTMPPPSSLEFNAVVTSMNTLSRRIKTMLQSESRRMDKLHSETHVDKITGLELRDSFVRRLASNLERNDAGTTGVLAIIRLSDMDGLNQKLSRKVVDNILAEMGQTLNALIARKPGWAAGRMNGSDFALLAPHDIDPSLTAREVQRALFEILKARQLDAGINLPGAAVRFQHGDALKDLLTNLDAMLLSGDKAGQSTIGVVARGDNKVLPARQNLNLWTNVFREGFEQKLFSLDSFPVYDFEDQLLHLEAPVRLQRDGKILPAGQFLHWINRLELAAELDKHVIELALAKVRRERSPICINLSYAAISDPDFLPWLSVRLSSAADSASQLWLEFQEDAAYRHLEMFKKLAVRTKTYGCKIGLEHVGHQLSSIGLLHDAGIDYLKIDAAFTRDIHRNPVNQTLLGTLCTLGHSLGLSLIAEGVQCPEEWNTLQSLGLDGATGPELTHRRSNKPAFKELQMA